MRGALILGAPTALAGCETPPPPEATADPALVDRREREAGVVRDPAAAGTFITGERLDGIRARIARGAAS